MRQQFATDLVSEEAARNVDLLAPHNHNFLPVENLLRDDRREATQEVALAINHDGRRGECGHVESRQEIIQCQQGCKLHRAKESRSTYRIERQNRP
jgi:hypothetical protein